MPLEGAEGQRKQHAEQESPPAAPSGHTLAAGPDAYLRQAQPIDKQHQQADDHQCRTQHAPAPLGDALLQSEHRRPFAQQGDEHGAEHGVGHHPPQGVEDSVPEHATAVLHILADVADGRYVGGQRTGRDGRQQPQQQGCQHRRGAAFEHRIEPFHNHCSIWSILWRSSALNLSGFERALAKAISVRFSRLSPRVTKSDDQLTS